MTTCTICGQHFTALRANARYCSEQCRRKSERAKRRGLRIAQHDVGPSLPTTANYDILKAWLEIAKLGGLQTPMTFANVPPEFHQLAQLAGVTWIPAADAPEGTYVLFN